MKKNMIKMLSIILVTSLLFLPTVQAVSPRKPDITTGSDSKTKVTEKKESAALALEKRLVIKSNVLQLQQLRSQLRIKINDANALLLQYKAKETLTDADRTQIKALIENVKSVKQTLGKAYQSINGAITKYKGDQSADKTAGLDLVIGSQNERILLLKEAIAKF